MPWKLLFLASLFEVGFAVGLKYSDGFTRLWPIALTLVCTIASFWLLSLAMKSLPMGTAYAVWVGLGTVGTVIFGLFFLAEPFSTARLASMGLIVAGVIGLKLTTPV